MEFKSLPIKPSYYTNAVDISTAFYNPVLEIATSYDRVSGYFSSQALAHYSKGLEGLLQNGGKMRLIISENISEEDYNLIKKGYDLREVLQQQLLDKLDAPLTLPEEVNFCNLAYLIALNKVDIKIGFKTEGLFHSKFGLCEDAAGNVIYFSGSNNETSAAISHNYEAFDVTASWLCSDFDAQKIKNARKEFERLWSNKAKDTCIFVEDFNKLIKQKLIKYDKGSLILNPEMLIEDALILSVQDDTLVLKDNLVTYEVNPKDLALKKLVPYLDGDYPNFKSDLTYMEMNEVIKILKRYSERRKFKFIVSQSLEIYLEQQSYWIEERSKYALLLKSQDPKIQNQFEHFKRLVSTELARPLREKQMWSAFYMYKMKRAANFSVPGAGKTSMIYGVFAYLNSSEIQEVDRIVMIGPKNAFLSWKLEFAENFGHKKELHVLDIHEEDNTAIALQVNSFEKNIILVNYESLQKYESILTEIIDNRTMLVFDEVHKVKGIRSKRAQVAKRIAEKPLYKYVLTGTPIPNTYEDIFNFLNILYTTEYKKFFNFKVSELKKPDLLKVEKINEKLYPFFWRTTKTELQVPPANEDLLLPIVANTDEQAIIDLLYKKYAGNPLHLYIRLMQAASNPSLLLKVINQQEMYGEEMSYSWLQSVEKEVITFTEDEIQLIRQVSVTSKFKAAINLAMDLKAENKQVIIWCMFVNTIDKVKATLEQKGLKNAAVIYGSTPTAERDDIIKAFKAREIDILITNPHTLAESVSLHHTCHDAIYLEYSFNLTHMLQSRDRIHRLGLKDDDYTQYYYFMLEGQEGEMNTVDQRIYDRLKEKEQRMIAAIEDNILLPDPEVDYDDIVELFK